MVLRKYEAQDSKIICSWIKDTKQLYQWSADRIGRFPLNGNELNEYYGSMNGTQPIIPHCAIDGCSIIGHLFIRYPNKDDKIEEYIQANCEYPGTWDGTIERIEQIGDLIITAINVYSVDRTSSFHVVSFIKLKDDKIIAMDEYWGDDGAPPQWRLEKRLGRKIHT